MKNFKLVYSKEFIDSFSESIEFIKNDSLQAARLFERTILKRIKLLKQFPEMGRTIDDPRLEKIRIQVIGNYLVLYEVIRAKKLIYLHTFCHGARDYPKIFRHLKESKSGGTE